MRPLEPGPDLMPRDGPGVRRWQPHELQLKPGWTTVTIGKCSIPAVYHRWTWPRSATRLLPPGAPSSFTNPLYCRFWCRNLCWANGTDLFEPGGPGTTGRWLPHAVPTITARTGLSAHRRSGP